MLFPKRLMSAHDARRLVPVLRPLGRDWTRYAPHLDSLQAEVRRAATVRPADVPADVITMNSRFLLSSPGGGGPRPFTLVYPDEADAGEGRVSILSPMGGALLGARVGSDVCWLSADSPEVARVERIVYQPEAAGDFHL